MTYATGSLILSTDFNTLIGGNPTTISNTLNTVWAIGGTAAGYGQTALTQVSGGGAIAASDWANLAGKTSNSAAHQGTTILAVTSPVAGGSVAYQANIATNLTTIYDNRLNAGVSGSSTANSAIYNSPWSTQITFTHTVTFANAEAARYFFNAGGQLKVTCSHANTTPGINLLVNQLASNVGTITQSAPTSTTVTIAGVNYTGITKIGGGGNSPTILSTTSGYYSMTTAPIVVFNQTATGSPASYVGTYIQMRFGSNGTQGSNGDRGSIITISTLWDEVPNGLTVGSGSTTTVTAVAPETTYLANTWGAISISGIASSP
jgi:hypothetical protein